MSAERAPKCPHLGRCARPSLLARAFLAADDGIYWEVPDGWFSDEGITIDFADAGSPDDQGEDGPEGPAVVSRAVAPPLRRWATAWVLRRDPGAWGPLLTRAGDLDARSNAAMVLGLLDAIACLTSPAQELLIAKATRWPDQAVRRRGLALVAEREGPDAAYAIAHDDPNARIRAWAETLVAPVLAQERKAGTDGQPRPTSRAKAPDPPTLF